MLSPNSLLKELDKEFGPKLLTKTEIIEAASKAPYLVSPILSKLGKKVIGVIRVESEDEISVALNICDKYNFPVVARGAGTSTIGQVLPIRESIVIDTTGLKKMEYVDEKWIRIQPGVRVLDALNFLRKRGKELRVYPSSFYISTLGGYIAGGDVGIGSFQYGYHFENNGIRYCRVIGPKGIFNLYGIDTLAVAQAAGTTGIISEAEVRVIEMKDWKDQIIRVNSIEEVIKLLRWFNYHREKIRRVTIQDGRTLRIVGKERVEKAGEWNIILASTLSLGEEVNLRFLDELAFAAIYVTMSKLTDFKNYFYEVRLLSLDEFNRVVSKVKKALGDSVLIHGDVMTIRGEIIIYTVFMSEKENFEVIDTIMHKEGIPFEIHSIEVNDRVDEPFRLELMKKYKLIIDPHNILNPGKLRI